MAIPLGEVGLYVLPRSLHFMADVRAARTKEKVGHSGRDDRDEEEGTYPSQTARRVGPPGEELRLFGFVGEGEFGFFV